MKQLSTSKADIMLLNSYSIKIRIKDRMDLDAPDMLAINDAKFKLVGDEMHTVLFVPGKFGTITKEAREVSATKEVNRNAIAKAIVTKELSQRLIAGFFIRFNSPPAPTRLFRTEEEAVEWLDEMTEKHFRRKEKQSTLS